MSNEFDDIMKDFEVYMMNEAKKELNKVDKDIESTLKQNIITKNRLSYMPKQYHRSNDIITKLRTHKNTDGTESIITWDGLNYESVTGQDVSDKVLEWVNDGFGDKRPFDYFNSRPKQAWMESCVNQINKKYKDNVCEIIRW